MLVKDYVQNTPHDIVTAKPDTPVPEAMEKLIKNKISCLPVVDDNQELVGIISDKDIFRKAHSNPSDFTASKVGDLMSTELIVGLIDDDFTYIAGVMTKNRIRHVPIVEEKRLIGLLSIGDIVKAQLQSMEIENRYLKQYIHDQYPG